MKLKIIKVIVRYRVTEQSSTPLPPSPSLPTLLPPSLPFETCPIVTNQVDFCSVMGLGSSVEEAAARIKQGTGHLNVMMAEVKQKLLEERKNTTTMKLDR